MTVLYKGNPIEIEKGTTYEKIAERFALDCDAPVILAKLGQKLVELSKEINISKDAPGNRSEPPVLEFITTRSRDGHKTYERGATMMLLRAAQRVSDAIF